MTRILALAILLSASACSQQESGSAPANEVANTAQAPVEETVPSLEGSWQVASIEGKPVAGGSAMTAQFTAGKAVLGAGCLRRAWTYAQKRNVVTFAVDSGGSSNCGGTSGEQETAFAALTEANIVIFNKDGSTASLSGTGGNLSLERR